MAGGLCEFSIFIKFLEFDNHTKNLYLTRKYLDFEANLTIFAQDMTMQSWAVFTCQAVY